MKVHDRLQGEPKESCNPHYTSVDQENLKHWNMEHQNNVKVREDSPGNNFVVLGLRQTKWRQSELELRRNATGHERRRA